MTPSEITVITASLVLIIAILYYFFGPKDDKLSATNTRDKQSLTIVVDGAFIPAEVKLKTDIPTEIIFDRKDSGECTNWVIFDRLPTKENQEVKSFLEEGKKTSVYFTPTKVGTYGFACGMGMNHGQLIVTK